MSPHPGQASSKATGRRKVPRSRTRERSAAEPNAHEFGYGSILFGRSPKQTSARQTSLSPAPGPSKDPSGPTPMARNTVSRSARVLRPGGAIVQRAGGGTSLYGSRGTPAAPAPLLRKAVARLGTDGPAAAVAEWPTHPPSNTRNAGATWTRTTPSPAPPP